MLAPVDETSSYEGGGIAAFRCIELSPPSRSGCEGTGDVGGVNCECCAGVGALSMYGFTPTFWTGLSGSSISNGPRWRFARRRRYQYAVRPIAMTKATPPTVPPTMAPTFVELFEGLTRGEKPMEELPSRGMLKML